MSKRAVLLLYMAGNISVLTVHLIQILGQLMREKQKGK